MDPIESVGSSKQSCDTAYSYRRGHEFYSFLATQKAFIAQVKVCNRLTINFFLTIIQLFSPFVVLSKLPKDSTWLPTHKKFAKFFRIRCSTFLLLPSKSETETCCGMQRTRLFSTLRVVQHENPLVCDYVLNCLMETNEMI